MAMIDKLFDSTMPGLEKMLDLTYRRNEAITSNIANAETPQYRAADVNFAGELERAFGEHGSNLKTTNTKHLDLESASEAKMISDLSGATKGDGNNVDIDIQMGKLAYNSGQFSIAAGLVRRKLQTLRTAIQQAMR